MLMFHVKHMFYVHDLPIRRVAILRALKLGDLLCTVPAFWALRASLPRAEIHLVAHPWAAEIVDRFDAYLDGLFELPGFPGFSGGAVRRAGVPALPRRGACLVAGSGPSNVRQRPAFQRAGLAARWAPDRPASSRWAGAALTGRSSPTRAISPRSARHLHLLAHLGIEARGEHKEFPLRPTDERALADVLDGYPPRSRRLRRRPRRGERPGAAVATGAVRCGRRRPRRVRAACRAIWRPMPSGSRRRP